MRGRGDDLHEGGDRETLQYVSREEKRTEGLSAGNLPRALRNQTKTKLSVPPRLLCFFGVWLEKIGEKNFIEKVRYYVSVQNKNKKER